MEQMKIMYVSKGDPEGIPEIGSLIEIKEHLLFRVEAYGESNEIEGPNGLLKVHQIELLGCLVIPKGSPMQVLEDLLEGKI